MKKIDRISRSLARVNRSLDNSLRILMTLDKQGNIVPKFGDNDPSVDEFEDLDFEDVSITREQMHRQMLKWTIERGNDMTKEEKDAEMDEWMRQDRDGWQS